MHSHLYPAPSRICILKCTFQVVQNKTSTVTGLSSQLADDRLGSKDPVCALPLRIGLSTTSETWTSVTDDIEYTRHLIALYFCWEYPNLASVCKEHFLRDFHAKKARFCSSLLVNALLALGSQLSDRCSETDSETTYVSGDAFFEEARRLLPSAAGQNTLTTIQALGIMSLREARCGRIAESKYYAEQSMLLATENSLHTIFDEHHPDRDVLSKAFWGTFMLNQSVKLSPRRDP